MIHSLIYLVKAPRLDVAQVVQRLYFENNSNMKVLNLLTIIKVVMTSIPSDLYLIKLDRLEQRINHGNMRGLDYKELAREAIDIIKDTSLGHLTYLKKGENPSVLGIYNLCYLKDTIENWKKYLIMPENEGSITNKIFNFIRKHKKAFGLCILAGITIGGVLSYLCSDPDQDGLTTFEEIFLYHTNPYNPDSDGASILDGYKAGKLSFIIENITSDKIVTDKEFEQLKNITIEAIKKTDNNRIEFHLKPVVGSIPTKVTLKYEGNKTTCWWFNSGVKGSYGEFLSILDVYKKVFDNPTEVLDISRVTIVYKENGDLKSKSLKTIEELPAEFENFNHAHVDMGDFCYYMPGSNGVDYARLNCDWNVDYKAFIRFYNELINQLSDK